MRIYTEISLENFEAWSGAEDTLNRIIKEGKCDELEAILEDLYPDGIDETQLNDILRFEEEQVFEWLGIRSESEIKEELEEAMEELSDLWNEFIDDTEDMDDAEKDEYYNENYKGQYEWLEERIRELEEELESI